MVRSFSLGLALGGAFGAATSIVSSDTLGVVSGLIVLVVGVLAALVLKK